MHAMLSRWCKCHDVCIDLLNEGKNCGMTQSNINPFSNIQHFNMSFMPPRLLPLWWSDQCTRLGFISSIKLCYYLWGSLTITMQIWSILVQRDCILLSHGSDNSTMIIYMLSVIIWVSGPIVALKLLIFLHWSQNHAIEDASR